MSQSDSFVARLAQPFLHLVGGFVLQPVRALREIAQELFALRRRQAEEVVLAGASLRCGAGHHRIRVLQFGRRIGGAAHFARVAVLVLRAALRALALDEAVRQEHFLHRIVELLDRTLRDQIGGFQLAVDVFAEDAVLVRIGLVIIVETDHEAAEVARRRRACRQSAEEVAGMFVQYALDQLARRDAFLFGAQHDGRAVLVVRADVMHLVAAHALEAHPDVGLDVFDQMTEMDGAVGVGQGAGDEQATAGHDGERCGKPAILLPGRAVPG
jgi:hypothetical protein